MGFSRGAQLYSIEVPVSFRYYFSLGKRMKQRVDRHSFFSHYIAIYTHNVLISNVHYNPTGAFYDLQKYYRGQITKNITNVGVLDESYSLMQSVALQLGTQVKMSRNNYLDINAVIPVPIYHKYDYVLSTPALINIKYGLFWQK